MLAVQDLEPGDDHELAGHGIHKDMFVNPDTVLYVPAEHAIQVVA